MSRDEILIVVVLYGEQFYRTATYRSLVVPNAHMAVYVYDNSPLPMHSDGMVGGPLVEYISDPSNRGLSYAYNRAAAYARQRGYGWLLLADQDTVFGVDVVSAAIEAQRDNPSVQMFVPQVMAGDCGVMSPVKRRFCGGRIERTWPVGLVDSNDYFAINSGILISIEAFDAVGGYNERVPLDFSDQQFCERFAQKYGQFYVTATVCHQQFSDLVQSFDQKLSRFVWYCRGAKGSEKRGVWGYFSYLCTVLRRTLSLCLSGRSLRPLRIFISEYL